MDDAACKDKDPEIFFPEKGESVKGNEAILTCFNCSVRTQCNEYKKISESTDGIWAGEYSQRKKRA